MRIVATALCWKTVYNKIAKTRARWFGFSLRFCSFLKGSFNNYVIFFLPFLPNLPPSLSHFVTCLTTPSPSENYVTVVISVPHTHSVTKDAYASNLVVFRTERNILYLMLAGE